MLFFVMYDIESNKVRYLIAKYLERHGCTRIQVLSFLPTSTKPYMIKLKLTSLKCSLSMIIMTVALCVRFLPISFVP